MSQALLPRFLESRVSRSLGFMRVVAVTGPRQSGKTTLARKFMSDKRSFHSLGDPSTYNAVVSDPDGFVGRIEYGAIDEAQRSPELLSAIKFSVDSDKRPGRFLLTGSSDVLTLPKISRPLAGRMAIERLLPLAQAELEGAQPSFLDDLFEAGAAPKRSACGIEDLERRVLTGGYPGMQGMESEAGRWQWAENWLEGTLKLDISEMDNAYRIQDLPGLVRLCAAQSGQIDPYAKMAKRMETGVEAIENYTAALEHMHLLEHAHPWSGGDSMPRFDAPKMYFLDSGLSAAIRQIGLAPVRGDRALFGHLLESFVFTELLKMAGWSSGLSDFHYYRDGEGNEVDFVVSRGSHAVAGVGIKASAGVQPDDLAGLRRLREVAGSSFRNGVLLYAGEEVVPFGDGLFAAPVSALWS